MSGDICLLAPLQLSHCCVSPAPRPGPPCTPELTVLSTQATERPAKRLATPRATLTSSLRMSSHLLLRNLNNLSVYVATPGERRKGRLVDQSPDMSRSNCHRGWGHWWMGHLLKVNTPAVLTQAGKTPVFGVTQVFSVKSRDSEAYHNGQPGLRNYGSDITATMCLR